MANDQDRTTRLLDQAERARIEGRMDAAIASWRQVIARDPANAPALNALGMQALTAGDPAAATLFARAAAVDPSAAALWMNLATAQRRSGNAPGERQALESALATDQRHLMANVRLAELHDRLGEDSAAAFRWQGVASIVEALPERTPELDQLLVHARGRLAKTTATFASKVETELGTALDGRSTYDRRRFDACVDAMLGRRRVYHNEPHGLHYPFLPADEFFPQNLFPWFAELEAATPAIRHELEQLLGDPEGGFSPYVEMTLGSPTNKWTPLDRSEAWSARYLLRYGVRQDDVCARCPQAAAALARVPLADMPGKGPTAFFSVLKAGTRLPAHTGVSNVRAVVHLPLIVPPGCGFRVGGETRDWVEGRAFAFDDTIEHEAWNESDAIRAVLILDVWNPHLSADERDMLRELFRTLGKLEDVPAGMGAVAE